MKYVALLRGINVGGNHTMPMATLRNVFEQLGFEDVTTYINSGNVLFSSISVPGAGVIHAALEQTFGFSTPVLVLTGSQVASVAAAIPEDWQNDKTQKSDVLYLFPEVDDPAIMDLFSYNTAIETVTYVPGALLATISRDYQSKSCLLKLVGTPLYRHMTVRNITTARKLASLVSTDTNQ